MSVITKVTAQKRKGHYNIFLDGHFAFGVNERTLTNFRLFKGNSLSDEQIIEIKEYEADSKAVELAMNYLSYQPRSIYDVLVYLKDHQIGDDAAQSAVSQLIDLGYLDDAKFSELFIKNDLQVGKDGPKSLSHKLQQKGVSSEIIEQKLADIETSAWRDAGIRVIKSLKHQVGRMSVNEIKRKAKIKLMSHGFTNELIEMIVEELSISETEDDQLEALKKQGIKAYRRYRNQDDFTRKQKVRRYLFQHGFSGSEIDSFLNGELVELEELNDY
ncbi:regulatory protein [Lactobacillus colini]|uniref:Regulatory protein RecX n=1 Tax=Lactobacillus colini TaxID=1819254 RepID=A0ABS4ME28_9LACO|nr:recombination regulator RecX [Lactobacillus colini]MBP2057601.1 regulatory protein [Lactobacillus colini]